MDQQPHIRAHHRCPCCGKAKDKGLLLCWPCHRQQKNQNDGDYSAPMKRHLDNWERVLATRALNYRLGV